MNTLQEIYDQHTGRLLNKWQHYIKVYDQYFPPYRNKQTILLEFGIAHGGSLEMWRKYFGPDVQIIGVDVNPECKKFEEGNTKIFIGSQEDKEFLKELKTKIPQVDLLIDDGGHTMKQQITTFEMMFDHVKDGGLYVCEDTHTSYWPEYYGGYKKKGSFIEYSKNFIDALHGWHFKKDGQPFVNEITKHIWGAHFYDSMVILEKRKMEAPQNTFKGQETLSHHFENYGHKKSIVKTIKKIVKYRKNS